MVYSVSRNPASATERAIRHASEPSIVATSASIKPTVASSGHNQPGHRSSQPQPGRLKLACKRYTPVPSQNEMEHAKLACAKALENSSWFTAFTFWLGVPGILSGKSYPVNQGIAVGRKQEAAPTPSQSCEDARLLLRLNPNWQNTNFYFKIGFAREEKECGAVTCKSL